MSNNLDPVRLVTTSATTATEVVLDTAESVVTATQSEFERTIAPVRQRFSQRYPVLFFGTVVIGATAAVLGIEQVLLQYQILQTYPWLILGLGVTLLATTGTLYKKLG